jgi:hypothetical protein
LAPSTTMTQLTKHYRSFCAVIFTKSLLLASSVIAQKAEPPQNPTELAAAADTAKPLNFRPPNASLNVNPSLESGAGISDLESLIDRRDSLEAEIRYSQNRMESDRKRVQVLQSLGQSEEADRLLTQVRDAEARIKTNRDQLVQIEDEVNRLQNNTSERGQGLTLGEEIILPGENLEVIVNEDAGFNNRYVVRRGGYIIMPGIGRVPVAGKTVIQAERDISQALKQTQLKRATVTVERFQGVNDESTVIYLAGEFRNPRPCYSVPVGGPIEQT